MISNNPRSDKFITNLPKNFFKESIIDKYNRFIGLQNSYLKTIDQIVNESIMRIDVPGFNSNPSQQNTVSGTQPGQQDTTYYPDATPLEQTIESTDITITFRHLDSYINYWFMFELFYNLYIDPDYANKNRFTIPLICLDSSNHPVFVAMFSKCLFKSIVGLNLNYDNQSRDFKEFQCVFTYSDFSVNFDLPQGLANQYTTK